VRELEGSLAVAQAQRASAADLAASREAQARPRRFLYSFTAPSLHATTLLGYLCGSAALEAEGLAPGMAT
jgi:hypothetical protein